MSKPDAPLAVELHGSISVTIAHANPTHVDQEMLTLPVGARVRDALAACTLGVARAHANAMQSQRAESDESNEHGVQKSHGEHIADSFVGIWGRRVLLDAVLTDGDRIELYRPVIADAKAARLNRASEQGYRWQARTRRAATRT